MKRPRGFTFISLFLLYIFIAGIVKGIQFAASYGIAPGIICFFYGLSAMVAAIGLWLFSRWAFHALIIWSISVLLMLFNYQYGPNGYYASLYFFIPYAIIVSILLVLLIYYVQKKLKEAGK